MEGIPMDDKLKGLRKSMTRTIMKDVIVRDDFKRDILQKTQSQTENHFLWIFKFFEGKLNVTLSFIVCSFLLIGISYYTSNEMGLLSQDEQTKLTNGSNNTKNEKYVNHGAVNTETVITIKEQELIENYYEEKGWSDHTKQYNQLNSDKYMEVLNTAKIQLEKSGYSKAEDGEVKFITEKNNHWIVMFKNGVAVEVDGDRNEVIKTWIVD
jgi:hypothetical protein